MKYEINITFRKKSIVFWSPKILSDLEAIDPVIEYYTIFSDFEKQSSNYNVNCNNIFINDNNNNNLNARDAWSKIIIFYANYNINMTHKCINNIT